MSDTLTPAQYHVLWKIAKGYKVIRRGTTLRSKPRLALKGLNDAELSVPYGTINKLMDFGFLDERYKITTAGRKEVKTREPEQRPHNVGYYNY